MSAPTKPRQPKSVRVPISVTRAIREVSQGNHRPLTIAGAIAYLKQLNAIGQWRVIAYLYGRNGMPETNSPRESLARFIVKHHHNVPHDLYRAAAYCSESSTYPRYPPAYDLLTSAWLEQGLMLQRLIDELERTPGGETHIRRIVADLHKKSTGVGSMLKERLDLLLADK